VLGVNAQAFFHVTQKDALLYVLMLCQIQAEVHNFSMIKQKVTSNIIVAYLTTVDVLLICVHNIPSEVHKPYIRRV